MKILFACNKCEENEIAREKDIRTPTNSDNEGEDDDTDDTDGVSCEERLSKGEAVFQKLIGRSQIHRDENIKTCDHFFQLSCKAVRKARHAHGKIPEDEEEFLNEFHRLITHTICHFQDCVSRHLEKTVSTLFALATQAFDFFVSDKFLSQRTWNKFNVKMAETKKIEENVIEKIRSYIEDQKSLLYDSIKMIIDDRKAYIIAKAENLDFLGKSTGKKWTSGTTKIYRDFLSGFLLHTVSEEIISKGAVSGLLSTIDRDIQTKIHGLFNDCSSLGGIGDLLPQLESCYHIVLSAPTSRSFSKHLLRKALQTRIVFAFEQFAFHHFHAPTDEAQGKWRRTTVKRLLDSIAIEELGDVICDQLSSQIHQAHKRFLDVLELIEVIHKRRRLEQRNLLSFIPSFSFMICKLRALKGEIMFGEKHVIIEDLLANDTNRNLVFNCLYGGRKAAARRVKSYDETQHEEFAKLINYAR
jgi:hypothetical protein